MYLDLLAPLELLDQQARHLPCPALQDQQDQQGQQARLAPTALCLDQLGRVGSRDQPDLRVV